MAQRTVTRESVIIYAGGKRKETRAAEAESPEIGSDDLPACCHILDSEGRIINVNAAWRNVFGFAQEEVEGKPFADLLSPEYTDCSRENIDRLKAEGETHGVEYEMAKKDGSLASVVCDCKAKTGGDGSFKGAICILYDVTLHKQIESGLRDRACELEKAAASIGDELAVEKSLAAELRRTAEESARKLASEEARAGKYHQEAAHLANELASERARATQLATEAGELKSQVEGLRQAAGSPSQELDSERKRAAQLEEALASERARTQKLDHAIGERNRELESERGRARQLDEALKAEAAKALKLEETLAQRAAELESERQKPRRDAGEEANGAQTHLQAP